MSTVQERVEVDPAQDVAGQAVEAQKPRRTPLPKLQLFIVFLIQFAEPVTALVIYPFVNELVRQTGVTRGDEAKTGYYAGIIESTFFFSETFTVFAWGALSDMFGRKPVLLLGPLGLALSMLGFGLSKTFWHLVAFRALQGSFNGNIGVSKSIMAEITDSTNIGDAYALIPLMWSAGLTIGPAIGGVLSNPATRWPDTLGKIALLRAYPYFLPCAAASAIAFTSFLISSIALKETLHTKKHSLRDSWDRLVQRFKKPREESDESRSPLLGNNVPSGYGTSNMETAGIAPPKEERPPMSRLLVPSFLFTILNYGLLSFVDMSMSALIPLVFSTPIEYGGLSMDPFKIGTIMGAFGIVNGIMSALFLGSLIRRFGATNVFQCFIPVFFIAYTALPLANILARRAGGIDAYVIAVIVIQFAAMTMTSPLYASIGILVIQNAPSPALLGSATGAAQMAASGSRALAPAFASSLFSISIQHNLAGGYAFYYVLMALVFTMLWVSRYLPTPQNQARAT